MISIPVEYIHDVYDAIGYTSEHSVTFFKGSLITVNILEDIFYSLEPHIQELNK
jgi:hypothetical protein